MKKEKELIVTWLSNFIDGEKIRGFVIGVSGGVDSGVVSTLCAETGHPVMLLSMPIHQGIDEFNRAKKHIEYLEDKYPNVSSREVVLTSVFEEFKKCDIHSSDSIEKREFVLSNTRARLRMTTLYQFAGELNYLVVGTGNKIEDFGIGFATKHGDLACDISPIGDLMKSEVYKMAEYLDLIDEIKYAVPTDGLHTDGRTDEDQIGATYDELEWAMLYIENNDTYTLSNRQKEVMDIYTSRHEANLHKMVEIPVCKIK